MSVQHMSWAYKQDLEPGAKFVLVTIANFADGTGSCYPDQDRLSAMTGMGLRTIRRHVQALEAAGMLTRAKRYRDDGTRTSDEYQLTTELPAKLAAGEAESLPAKPAGSEGSTTGQIRQDYRPNSTGLPAKLATSKPDAQQAEPAPGHDNTPVLPAKLAAITISKNHQKNHQNINPPTPQEKKKPKKARKRTHEFNPAEVAADLPDNFDRELFQDFCARRLEVDKPMTLLALKRFISGHKDQPQPVLDEMFRRAIVSGWQDLYPLDKREAAALTASKPERASALAQYEHLRSGGGS